MVQSVRQKIKESRNFEIGESDFNFHEIIFNYSSKPRNIKKKIEENLLLIMTKTKTKKNKRSLVTSPMSCLSNSSVKIEKR
jgi:hypothetical protein